MTGNGTNCHTFDRSNLLASLDCGVGATSILKHYIDAKTTFDYWHLI
jgi:hypothetical protein